MKDELGGTLFPTGPEGVPGAIGHQGPPELYFTERLYGPAAPRVLELERELRDERADNARVKRENSELLTMLGYATNKNCGPIAEHDARIREILGIL